MNGVKCTGLFVALAGTVLALAACGQKGPLVKPGTSRTPAHPHSSTPAATPATAPTPPS